MADPVYLDYNATTPLLPEVTDAMLPFIQEAFGNPSSSHLHGVMPRRAVASAREQVASLNIVPRNGCHAGSRSVGKGHRPFQRWPDDDRRGRGSQHEKANCGKCL